MTFVAKGTSGTTDGIEMAGVYIDTNAFIYAIEGSDPIARQIQELFVYFRDHPGTAVTSELTLAEVLPKAGPPQRRSYFSLIIWSGIFDLRPITRDILVETATYRSTLRSSLPDGRTTMPRLPDAIHVVTAIRSGCDRILSADKGLKVPSGVSLFPTDQQGLIALKKGLP